MQFRPRPVFSLREPDRCFGEPQRDPRGRLATVPNIEFDTGLPSPLVGVEVPANRVQGNRRRGSVGHNFSSLVRVASTKVTAWAGRAMVTVGSPTSDFSASIFSDAVPRSGLPTLHLGDEP